MARSSGSGHAVEGFGTPLATYKGLWNSSTLQGVATIDVTSEGICATAGGKRHVVPFADVFAITSESWAVMLELAHETISLSQMGQDLQWLRRNVLDAFNDKVAAALFVEGPSVLSVRGAYRIEEQGRTIEGGMGAPEQRCDIRLFDDCLCILPPDCQARRIPLAFVRDVRADDYSCTVLLDTGEAYTFWQLGFDLEPLLRELEACRQHLLDRSAGSFMGIDPSLSFDQATRLALRMPDGTGASLTSIAEAAPTFPKAIATFLARRDAALAEAAGENEDGTSAAPACPTAGCLAALQRMCPPQRLFVGVRAAGGADGAAAGGTSGLAGAGIGGLGGMVGALGDFADASNHAGADAGERELPAIDLWFVALSEDGTRAVVEYALANGEQSATFAYRATDATPLWPAFNRALEAMGSNRACIRLGDDELAQPRYRDVAMALRRTPALRFARSRFAERIIHANPADWERKVRAALEA